MEMDIENMIPTNGDPNKVQKFANDKRNVTYIINEEDHTLGNVLQYILASDKAVSFGAYSVPHPNESNISLRIQLYDKSKSSTDGMLMKSLDKIVAVCDHVSESFDRVIQPEMK